MTDGAPAAELTVAHVGEEREPVVVLDGATGRLAELVAYAATQSRFEPAAAVGSGYPGLLGPAPTAYVDGLVRLVLPLLAAHFGTGPVRPVRARGNFSLVTVAPDALSPDQRLPHVDAADRMQFAVVHFLGEDDHGGTGFFRHAATGFEVIDAERLPAYRAALDQEGEAPADGGYADGEDGRFRCVATVDARPDRLLLYRSALLHSGLVRGLPPQAADPRRGRLTGNLFLQCRAA